MIRFEHKVTPDVIHHPRQQELEAEGWELVSVVQPLGASIGGAVPSDLRLYWKRPWRRKT